MAPLVTAEALYRELAGPAPPVLLDVRWALTGPPGRLAYQAAHLPGAVFVDLDAELAGPPGPGGRHPLPDPEALQAMLRRAGIDEGSAVVAYDAADGASAARCWWLLRWAGLSAGRVAVLDGGYREWLREGLPVSADVPAPRPGDVVVRPGGMPVLDADAAAAIAASGGILLDARVPARYRGETEPIDPVAGHVPGAVNAPFTDHVGSDGRWLAPERLRERFTALGVTGERPVAAYCGSGVTAAAVVLALEHAGLPTAALYAGSWSHWVTDPRRPVATGPEPDRCLK